MKYISTRGEAPAVSFTEALLGGIAPDGGLYLPETWPKLAAADIAAAAGRPYAALVREVLAPFVGGTLPGTVIARAAARLEETFHHAATAPLVQLEPNLWVLELFHGPTSAFKDLAMQLMAGLADAALAGTGERLLLLTATSGDTGAAAVRAFAGADNIDLVVLHPLDRVSPVQRRQMTTVGADNVLNLAVRGDFDDCQTLVKGLLAEPSLREGRRVSSVNSINWARLAGQIPYYLAAASALGAPARSVRFVVPTGNFGDAFAGWAARAMGVPLDLIAAVNRNDALARAINAGRYERTNARATASVSMDVQAPSNFERLVFEAGGRDAGLTRRLFERFARDGAVDLPTGLLEVLRAQLAVTSIDEQATRVEIATAWRRYGRTVCPHTAVALGAARRLDPREGPVVVLATAHPAKFPDVIADVLGFAPAEPPAFASLSGGPERLVPIPAEYRAALTEIGRLLSGDR